MDTGGRYNPLTGAGSPTSAGANVPSARYLHTRLDGQRDDPLGGRDGSGDSNTVGPLQPVHRQLAEDLDRRERALRAFPFTTAV